MAIEADEADTTTFYFLIRDSTQPLRHFYSLLQKRKKEKIIIIFTLLQHVLVLLQYVLS